MGCPGTSHRDPASRRIGYDAPRGLECDQSATQPSQRSLHLEATIASSKTHQVSQRKFPTALASPNERPEGVQVDPNGVLATRTTNSSAPGPGVCLSRKGPVARLVRGLALVLFETARVFEPPPKSQRIRDGVWRVSLRKVLESDDGSFVSAERFSKS